MVKTHFWPRGMQLSLSFALIMDELSTSHREEKERLTALTRLLDIFHSQQIKMSILLPQKIFQDHQHIQQHLSSYQHELILQEDLAIAPQPESDYDPLLNYSLAHIEKITNKKFMGYQRYWLRD